MKVTTTLIEKLPVPEARNPDGTISVRSPGIHLSTILRGIAIETGILKVEKGKSAGRDFTISEEEEDIWNDYRKAGNMQRIPARMALGMAWEEWAARHLYPEMVWQPGECVRDGIAMTPDGVTVEGSGDKERLWLEEFKCTYKSSHVKGEPREIQGEWLWLAQCKSYCRGLGTRLARLHVLYVNGSYRFDGEVPAYIVYGIEFTAQEIRDNWGMVVREKQRREEEEEEEENGDGDGNDN